MLALRASGVRVVGVYDPDHARAEALAGTCGADVAPSFDALAAIDAELASVCSPPRAHVTQAEALAQGGRVVLLEKPVAVDADELARLRTIPRVVPIVQWRAGRAIRALRRAIAHGELGASPVASCDLAWGRDDAYVAARGEAWGCGALLSIGVHAIDALAWALGRRIEGVSGMTLARSGAAYETAAVALLRFAGGALASLRISIDGAADATRIAVCGQGVSAIVAGGEADPTAGVVAWSAASDASLLRLRALEQATPGGVGAPLLVPYVAGIVDALRDGYSPGEIDRLPSVESTADAHAAAMCVEAFSRRVHAAEADDSSPRTNGCHAHAASSRA